MTKPTCWVLLDRDGTVIFDKHYLHDPEGVEFLPGAVEGLARMRAMGCALVLVSNQSGVNRGYFGHSDVSAVNERMCSMFGACGVEFTAIYYCPHTPEENCSCRKPETGLIDRAAQELGFDPKAAFMIGDKICDVELGKRVGAVSILVRTGKGAAHEQRCQGVADHVVDDLVQAAEVISESLGREA